MQIIQQLAQQVIQQQVIQQLDINVESACIVGGLFLLAQSGRALIAAKAALVKLWRESGADSTAGIRSSTTNLRDELAQGIEILDQIPNITPQPSTNQNLLLEQYETLIRFCYNYMRTLDLKLYHIDQQARNLHYVVDQLGDATQHFGNYMDLPLLASLPTTLKLLGGFTLVGMGYLIKWYKYQTKSAGEPDPSPEVIPKIAGLENLDEGILSIVSILVLFGVLILALLVIMIVLQMLTTYTLRGLLLAKKNIEV